MVGRHSQEINQIERMAESKGVDIDDVEAEETTDDNGNQIVRFIIYETKAESEADSVAGRVQKLPDSPLGEQQFQDNVQSVLSELKRVTSSESELDRPERKEVDRSDRDDAEEVEMEEDPTASDGNMKAEPTNEIDTSVPPSANSDTPEQELLEKRRQLEERITELEQQVEEIKEYAEALEGLSKLVGDDDADEDE